MLRDSTPEFQITAGSECIHPMWNCDRVPSRDWYRSHLDTDNPVAAPWSWQEMFDLFTAE